jgi:DNA-binding XRE family transcriptional regulator
MKLEPLPEMVQVIIARAGALGSRGAFACIGATASTYRCAKTVGEHRSSRPSRLVSERGQGFKDCEVGLQCRVNGKRWPASTLIIACEPTDVHAFGLVRVAGPPSTCPGGRPSTWQGPILPPFALNGPLPARHTPATSKTQAPVGRCRFADNLAYWRRHLNLSQKQAAGKLGIAKSTWSQWESGKRVPSVAYVALLAEALDLPHCSIFAVCPARCLQCDVRGRPA